MFIEKKKSMFRIVGVLLFALLFVSSCKEQPIDSVVSISTISDSVTNSSAFVRAEGKYLMVNKNDTINLKGTNIGNWLVPEGYMFKLKTANSPRKIDELLYELIGPDSLRSFWDQFLHNYIQYEDIKYLKSTGCNHIRLPFHYKLFTQDLYMGRRYQGFVYLDRIIEWCRKENLYVLLDMHCAPGGQTGDNIDDSYGYPYLYKSDMSKKQLSQVWQRIASKYKDDTLVLGYDLVNEPIAHYFDDEMDVLNDELFSIYKTVISDIRKIDTNHLIFVNGSNWSTDFSVFKDTLGDNVVYEFHKYWFDVNQKEIEEYLMFQNKHNVPIYIGETGENTDEWVLSFRELLEKNKVNWCFWPYKKMNNTKGIMNFEQPQDYELIINYGKSEPYSYKKIRDNRPDSDSVNVVLKTYLENCLYKNCFQNKGYINGLGLQVDSLMN